MLRSLQDLKDFKVTATDGDIGTVSGFIFDEEHWTIRYLVVDTGGFWAGPNRVLVSPISFREADATTKRFHLALTQDKVKGSPVLPLDTPLSRQYERKFHQYYDWPYYWGSNGVWGTWATPELLGGEKWFDDPDKHLLGESHLRQIDSLSGYVIHGTDEDIGHFQDFIVDDGSWAIRYIVVDTRKWWQGTSVVLLTDWISGIDDKHGKVDVDLTREIIKNSPEWPSDQPVDPDFEARLSDYYGRSVRSNKPNNPSETPRRRAIAEHHDVRTPDSPLPTERKST